PHLDPGVVRLGEASGGIPLHRQREMAPFHERVTVQIDDTGYLRIARRPPLREGGDERVLIDVVRWEGAADCDNTHGPGSQRRFMRSGASGRRRAAGALERGDRTS